MLRGSGKYTTRRERAIGPRAPNSSIRAHQLREVMTQAPWLGGGAACYFRRMIRKRQHLMLEFVQRVRCVSRTGSSGSLHDLLGWMEICLWRFSEAALAASDGCLRVPSGLSKGVQATFLSSGLNLCG